MWQRHLVFPEVPRGFWRRFRRRWAKPLRILEEAISLSEDLGADPESPRFETMDETYWSAIRSLHSRTCLHARSALALLSHGLIDPAWAQWRTCHESSTIARFIANTPEMAPRYIRYSVVNKYHLANELYNADHGEAPTQGELDELRSMATAVRRDLEKTYGRRVNSRDYAWSGLQSFRDIEGEVFQGDVWKPRVQYIFGSDRVHSAPNATEPLEVGDGRAVFVVGPSDSGITGPAHLTSLSILAATEALLLNASCTPEDDETLEGLEVKARMVGVVCWILDPEIYCPACGGYRLGASPPDEIPQEDRPQPCSCPME